MKQILKDCFIAPKPLVLESLLRGGPVLRVHLKHPKDEVPALVGRMSEVFFDLRKIALNIRLQKFLRSLSYEEVSAGQEVEEHGAEAEDVDLVGVARSSEDLGGHVARGAALVQEQLILGGEG